MSSRNLYLFSSRAFLQIESHLVSTINYNTWERWSKESHTDSIGINCVQSTRS